MTKRDLSQGHKYVETSGLRENDFATYKALVLGMQSTPQGLAHLETMRQAKKYLAPILQGSSFRMPDYQFKQYLKDGEK